VQHRQETEVAAAEKRERAAAETAATVARLAMAELAAARAEIEVAAVADAARAAAAELKALRASSTGSSVSADDDRDNELKLAREAAREQAAQWAGIAGTAIAAKEAWDAIAAARIGNDRARKTTLQALHKEWENLTFKPGEDVDDFALRLNTLQQKIVQFGDDTYGEERAIKKLFRCIPEKYKQITRSIESLLDLSTISIEEAIGRLKVIDGDKPQPLSGPITVGGKLHLTREQWEVCQGDGKKGESPPSTSGRKRGKRHKSREGATGNQKPT
jgi:hypothetical protein